MTIDDRLALEIGRLVLRAITAEERLAQALAAQDEQTDAAEKPQT